MELLLRWPFLRQQHWELRRAFAICLMRSFSRLTDATWFRDLSPTTGDSIRSACTAGCWTLQSHVLINAAGPDATLHEIILDTTTTGTVLLYFHGGGYHNPLSRPGHMPLVHELGTQLRASAVFLLEYSLTPEAIYPTQLQQAGIALRYLLDERGIALGDLVLGGDSAGAHLALTLVAHGMQPCPEVAARLPELEVGRHGRMKGLLLISPWVTMDTSAASFRLFDTIDMLSSARVRAFAQLFNPQREQIWAVPLLAGADFWSSGIPVERLMVTCGNAEVLRDPIIRLFGNLKAAEAQGRTRCELVLAEGEIHVHMALDHVLGLSPCESRRRVGEWCQSLSEHGNGSTGGS